MKRIPIFFLLAPLLTVLFCSRAGDLSGTYKKISGDYRYNTFVIEKIEGNRYSITALQDNEKKLKTTSELNENKMDMGWLATITFNKDYKEFFLSVGKGSVFKKIE